MEKNKKDLMILIVIIFIGVNYVIYTYFIISQLDSIKTQKNKYLAQKQKLNDIRLKKQSIDKKRKDLEKLKKETADFDNVVPKEINTPQLIYDFYTGCKLFGIVGQNIAFQLLDNNSDANKSSNVNSSTNSNTNVNSNSMDNKSKQPDVKFYTLTINLKVVGDKENVENFIKNLGVITKRKLNVKNITISSPENNNTSKKSSVNGVNTQSGTKAQSQPSTNKVSNTYTKTSFYIYNNKFTMLKNTLDKNYMNINFIDNKFYADGLVNEATQQVNGINSSVSSSNNSNNVDLVPSEQTSDANTNKDISGNEVPTNQLSAEIIFYQYIQSDKNKQIKVPENYEFYDSPKEGFNNISDMFK